LLVHKDVMIKYSSTKMAQKGKTPVRRSDGRGCSDLAHGGIWRGIWLTRVGESNGGCLKPNQLPAILKGTLITNQMPMSASMVVIGTAPLDPLAHTKRLRRKKVMKTIPGTSIGVVAILSFQFSPPNVLYTLAETYPPIDPRIVYSRRTIVATKPRFDGDRKPIIAKTTVNPVMTKICAPLPSKKKKH